MREFDLIESFFTPKQVSESVKVGVGDDAAVLRVSSGYELVVSVDTSVEGIHFLPDINPYDLGHRVLAVNLSDLAAMGAEPLWFTLALTIPKVNVLWLKAFSQGLNALAHQFSIELVGGDTTQGPLSITIQVFGRVPVGAALLRSQAQVGDVICVSGSLGDAYLGLKCAQGQMTLANAADQAYVLDRYYKPFPQVALGRALSKVAHAVIDVSDGLCADLNHVVKASGVGAVVACDQLPLSAAFCGVASGLEAVEMALSGGDDYELCFTLPACALKTLAREFKITVIGEVVEGVDVSYHYDDARVNIDCSQGYIHFSDVDIGGI